MFHGPVDRLLIFRVFGNVTEGSIAVGLGRTGSLPYEIYSHGSSAGRIQALPVFGQAVFFGPGENGFTLRAGDLRFIVHGISAVEEGEDMRDGADVIGAKGSLRFSLGDIGFGCPFYAVCIGGGVRNVGKGVKGVLGRGLLIRFVDVNKKLFSIYSRANG